MIEYLSQHVFLCQDAMYGALEMEQIIYGAER